MRTRFALPAALALAAAPALAHHGWGSYEAAHPVTVTGPITGASYEFSRLKRLAAVDPRDAPGILRDARFRLKGVVRT